MIALAFASLILAQPARAQARWSTLDEFLSRGIRLTAQELAAIARGETVAKMLPTVDTRDIADAAVNALLDPEHDGMTYAIVGPTGWTGESIAAAFTKHLGRPIGYVGDDLDRWEGMVKGSMPDWMVEDLVIMYRWFH